MQSLSQAASAAYYLGHCESHRSPLHYYSGGDEPDGRWWNPSGLLGLEDDTTIDANDFQSLYAGLSPDDQTPLTKNTTLKNRSPGLDITFSADKTISALWALADPQLREQIEASHHDAVRWTLETITRKHCAYTRRGRGGKEVLSGDILGVTFEHHTSRDNDPQLHTHCVIFNLVHTHDDGVWRTHHQRPAYQWVRAGGAVYRHALAWNLQERLKLRLERYGRDDEFVRLAGIPEELIKAWSTRRKTIEIAARKLGINTAASAALTQEITLGTRPRKDIADPAERDARFHQEATLYVEPRALIEELLSAGITRPDEAQVRAALDRCRQLPARLTIDEAVFTIPKLVEHIARESPGLVNPAGLRTMLARILKDRSVIALDQHRKGNAADVRARLSHTRLYSTLDYATEERSVQDLAARSLLTADHAIPREAVERRLDALMRDGYVIGAQQGEAVHHLAGADTSIAVCLGAAGAGKTVALRPVADLYRERGYRVIATAFSWRASLNLANETGAQPHSLERLFTQVHAGHTVLDDKTLLIVDEAGTLSVREMRTVLEIAERAGAKILLVGDLDQLQPIEAGPGLRLVVDQVGAAKIETIRRQRPDLEDLATWWFGDTPEAARARIELMTEPERAELLSHRDDYPRQGWQAQTSEAIRKGNARAAIDAYAERGRLHLESTHEHALAHLAQDWIAFRKQNPGASCLVIARTNREVRKLSEILRAVALPSGVDRPQATITVSRGEHGRKQTKELEISQGDLLRIGTTVFKHQLFNGSIVTVNEVRTLIEAGRERVLITATTEHHKDVTFYADEVHDIHGNIRLDHGYALTISSVQAATADRVFLLADDRPSRETVYPALTRHRDRLDVYIDSEPLALAVRRLRPEEDWASPVSREELYQHLAYRWSRAGTKEAALDYSSDAQQAHVNRRIADEHTRRDAARLVESLHPQTSAGDEPPLPEGLDARVLSRFDRRGGSFTADDVRFALWTERLPRDQLDGAIARILAHPDVMPLYGHDATNDIPRFATVSAFAAEEQLARRASRLRTDTTGPAPPAPRHIERALKRLSRGAHTAAQALVTARRLTVVSRPDDRHRRDAIHAAIAAFTRAGSDVIRCGADRRSLRVYGDTPAERTYTVHSLLAQLARHRPVLSRTSVILVNNAEALDTDTLYTLTRIADDAGVRLALVGDHNDDCRSPAFSWLTRRCGPLDAALRPPRRVAELLHRLDRSRNLVRVENDEDLTQSILSAWRTQQARSRNATQLVITSSAETAERFNTAIQSELARAGSLGKAHRFTVLRPSYTRPDGSRTHSNVLGRIPETTQSLTVHVGDRIRILENHPRGLCRGDIGTVTALSPSRITIDVDGAVHTFDTRHHNRFTLGYATSVYQRPAPADHVHAAVTSGWTQPTLYRATTTHRAGLTVHWRASPGQTLVDLAQSIASRNTPACTQFYLDRQRAIAAAHTQRATDHPLKTAWHLLSDDERSRIQRQDHDQRSAIHSHQKPRDTTSPWLRTAKPASVASALRQAVAYRTEGAVAIDYQREYDTLTSALSRIERTAVSHHQPVLDAPQYPDILRRLEHVTSKAAQRAGASNVFRLALSEKTRYTADDIARHHEFCQHNLRAHHLHQEARNMSAYFNARALRWSLTADTLHGELDDLSAVADETGTRAFFLDAYADCHPRLADLDADYHELARIRDGLASPDPQLLELMARFDTAAKPFLSDLAKHKHELAGAETVAAYKLARDTQRTLQDDLYRYQSTRTPEEQHAASAAFGQAQQRLSAQAAEIHEQLEWFAPHLEQTDLTTREIQVYSAAIAGGGETPTLDRAQRREHDRGV